MLSQSFQLVQQRKPAPSPLRKGALFVLHPSPPIRCKKYNFINQMSSPIDDLIAELGSNSELRKAITTATSVEAATIIANNYGFKIDAKDLLDAYRIRLMELSDDELEGISGGTNKWQLINHSKNEICKHL